MAITLRQKIRQQEKSIRQFNKRLKTLALEIEGQFKDNIGKQRVKPKTNKTKGATLFDTGVGLRSIKTIIRGTILKTGNFKKYMQYHLTGTKNLPVRNWLIKPPLLDKIVQAWQRKFMGS